jgi:hypothetical protein
MKKKMSVEDRERIEVQLKEIQEQKTRERNTRAKDLREIQKKRDDDKWDINHMSEFDFVRCDYSQW